MSQAHDTHSDPQTSGMNAWRGNDENVTSTKVIGTNEDDFLTAGVKDNALETKRC